MNSEEKTRIVLAAQELENALNECHTTMDQILRVKVDQPEVMFNHVPNTDIRNRVDYGPFRIYITIQDRLI